MVTSSDDYKSIMENSEGEVDIMESLFRDAKPVIIGNNKSGNNKRNLPFVEKNYA